MTGARALRGAAVAVCLAVAGWLACWQLWPGCLWWSVAGWGAARGLRGGWVALVVAGLGVAPLCVVGYSKRVEVLTERVRAGGPGALTLPDRVAVYGLNLVMAGVGTGLGFPEVALETASLAVPGNVDTTWRSSGFPLCDPDVAEVVEAQRRALRRGAEAAGPKKVSWPGYAVPGTSVRGALALNPARVSSERRGERVITRTTVPVDYQGFYALRLGRLGPVDLVVEEGLFHALQELGWLHPYQLTWEVEVGLDEPLPPLCEAWSVRVARAALGIR